MPRSRRVSLDLSADVHADLKAVAQILTPEKKRVPYTDLVAELARRFLADESRRARRKGPDPRQLGLFGGGS